ncbi:MAG: hypothetical protein ABL921_15165 [Pirellula sp.]
MSRSGMAIWCAVLILGLLPLAGCWSGTGASVSGNITLDGSPLDDANISFVPLTDGQHEAGWTTIKEGRYLIPASSGLGTGEFRVEIRALRTVNESTKMNDPTLVNAKEIIPSRYNSKSELWKEIKSGKNNADFDLKSK